MKISPPNPPGSLRFFGENFVKYSKNPKRFNFINIFPCLGCQGNGYNKDWTGIGSDYIFTDCGWCNGDGLGTEERFKEYHDNAKTKYKEERQIYLDRKAAILSAHKKLTPFERKCFKNYEL